jgi:cold shock protein
METGRVKWFDERKGYGFIETDSGQEVFAHSKCIEETGFRSLDEGDEVSFDIEEGKKGPLAAHIKKL